MICDLPSVSCLSHPLPFSFSLGFLCSVFLSGDIWGQCQFMLDSGGRFQQVKEKHQECFLPTELHYRDGIKSWMVSMKMGAGDWLVFSSMFVVTGEEPSTHSQKHPIEAHFNSTKWGLIRILFPFNLVSPLWQILNQNFLLFSN